MFLKFRLPSTFIRRFSRSKNYFFVCPRKNFFFFFLLSSSQEVERLERVENYKYFPNFLTRKFCSVAISTKKFLRKNVYYLYVYIEVIKEKKRLFELRH